MIHPVKKRDSRSASTCRLVLALGSAILVACGAQEDPPAAAPDAAPGALSFWRVAGGETVPRTADEAAGVAGGEASVYLLPWLPVRETTQLAFDPAIEDAFARASRLVLPNDSALGKQNALIGWKAHLAEGDALAEWISADLHAAYTRAIEAGGYPPGTAEVTAPWFAARFVEIADWKRTGFTSLSDFQSEFEKYFVHRARFGPSRHRPEVLSLEEAGASYDRYAALPRSTQTLLLRAALARSARAPETLPAAQDAWQRGDAGRLAELCGQPNPTTAAESERLANAVLRLVQEGPPGDATFLLAPACNVVGRDGLLARLEHDGLHVEQLSSDVGGGTLRTAEPASTDRARGRAAPPAAEGGGRVLVIGIDGATLRIVEPMLEAGRLPALAALSREGASGPLRSHAPIYSPRIWNSIATGKAPEKHGIEGFTYKDDEGRQQLYLSLHRRAHALWNIASDAGLAVGVVNWWNSYPPEVIRGVMVSDHAKPTRLDELRRLTGAVTAETAGATVHPAAWGPRVAEIFEARESITAAGDPFLGNLAIPPFMQREELSKRYYDDAAAAKIALEVDLRLSPDLLMVFLPGIDRVSHRLWAAVEDESAYPESLQLSSAGRVAAREALERYYAYTDELIGLLSQRFGPRDLVLVLSDHGFEAGEHLGDLTGVHDGEEALDGVLFARGPGIAPGTSTRGTSVNDVTPTVLAWLGLPQGRDMDGRPAAFLSPPTAQPPAIATHDTKEIDRLELAPSGSENAILDQLRALGYIE